MAKSTTADADKEDDRDGAGGPQRSNDSSLIVLGAEHLVEPDADDDVGDGTARGVADGAGSGAFVAANDVEEDAADEFDDAPATVFDPETSAAAAAAAERAHARQAAPASSGPFLDADTDAELDDEFDDDKVTVIDRSKARADSSGGACPKCGVTVAPGYPRCPRCKASLTGDETPRRAAAGGTSVVARTVPWTVVAVLSVATAGIVYLAERDPRVPEAAAAEGEAALQAEADPDEVAPEPEPAAPDLDRASALLAESFAQHGHEIALEIDEDGVLLLLSSGCEAEVAPSLVAGRAATLAAAGVTRVRCVADDDALIFERDLSRR